MFDIISEFFDSAWKAVVPFGWYILGIAVVLLYLSPQIQEAFNNWKRKKDESEYAAKYHKNPDVFGERLAKMEAARQRMQEKYKRDAEIAKQKEEERIERKRQELLKLTEGKEGGRKLGQMEGEASTSGSKSSSWKPEYNPLMGDSGRGYRAPKRSCCKKGGCG